MKIDLERAVEEAIVLPHTWRAYVDRETGEFHTFPEDDPGVLDDAPVEDFEQLLEQGRLVRLPRPQEIGEERVVEGFLAFMETRDADAHARLHRAWLGRPRWRLFRHALAELDLRDEYEQRLREAMRREIRDALDEEGLDSV